MRIFVDTTAKIVEKIGAFYQPNNREPFRSVLNTFNSVRSITRRNAINTQSLEQSLGALHSFVELHDVEGTKPLAPYKGLLFNGNFFVLNQESIRQVATYQNSNVFSFFTKEVIEHLPAQYFYEEQTEELCEKSLYKKIFSQRMQAVDLSIPKKYNNIDSLSILSTLLYDESLNLAADVIQLKSLCSGNSFDYKKVTYSEAKFRTQQCLLPVLVPAKIYDFETKQFESIHFYTFLFNSDPKKIVRYKKARQYLKKVLDSLILYNGTYFYDREMYRVLKYKSSLKRYVSEEQKDNFDLMQAYDLTSNARAFPKEELFEVAATYVYPEALNQKKAKLTRNKERVKNHIHQHRNDFKGLKDLITEIKSQEMRLENYKQRLKALQDGLERSTQELTEGYSGLPTHISNLKANILKSVQLNKASQELRVLFEQYQADNNKQVSPTLKALLNDYEFIDLEFNDKNHVYSFVKNYEVAKTLLNDEGKERYSFRKLHLRSKEPMPIRVNGSNTNVKVGGPYEIICTPGALKIRPLSVDSYYVLHNITEDTATILTHPHAPYTSINVTNNPWANACLGEASSLIYKSCQEWNLTNLIVSIDLWLKSANSTDTWGRRYDRFENWSDHLEYKTATSAFTEELMLEVDKSETLPASTKKVQIVTDQQHPQEEQTAVIENTEPAQQVDTTYTPYISLN